LKKRTLSKKDMEVANAYSYAIMTKCGTMNVTVDEDKKTHTPFRVWLELGRQGACGKIWSNFVGYPIALALADEDNIIRLIEHCELSSNDCPGVKDGGVACGRAIGQGIEKWYEARKERLK
jgi:hypothetical protein